MEGDSSTSNRLFFPSYFNPLPPHGGRLVLCAFIGNIYIFQSTPSAWRETSQMSAEKISIQISIHSLRMEGDKNIL